MNVFLKKIIQLVVLGSKRGRKISQREWAKAYRIFLLLLRRYIKDVILILSGIFSATLGLKGFLIINDFIDGGATGVSLLLSILTKTPVYIWLIVVNIPFVIKAFRVVNKTFAIKTLIAISLLAFAVAKIDFPEITHDKLLVAVFGGFFLGAGIGLSVRGGAVIDGTEVLAIYLSKKLGTTIGDIIILINIVIFSTAAYLLSIETAMYSMITYLAASKTLDFVVEGLEEYTGVTIVSPHNEDIRQMITEKLGKGVTVYNGKRGYGKRGETKNIDIIYTVVSRLELNKLNTEIEKIDPNAFIVMNSIKHTKGGMLKKRDLLR
jgi:uncharacterized membrane-anchored protein YitT (DUF2179 family)